MLWTIFVLLLVLLCAALALGNSAAQVGEAYYTGLWMLLPFTMQMTLIIVLSATLASTPVFRTAIAALARLPRSTAQVVAGSVLITAVVSYFYWGLGVVLGPMMDIKLYLMYTRIFRPRLIWTIILAVVVQVFLYTALVHVLWENFYVPTFTGTTP